MPWKLVACVLVAVVVAGCGGGDTTPPASQAGVDVPTPPPAPPLPPGVEPKPVATKPAVPGVGKKGKGYGGGYIAKTIATKFTIEERIVFDIQIASGMNTYRAINGHFPKSHEEFMEEIVEKGRVKLPILLPNERYRYDPEKAATQKQYEQADPPLWVDVMPPGTTGAGQ